ncbi:hypothetical protein EON83_02625 [bacterium]|nr:MAG: hypothetical protein EON83_02625 [bacterium]
MKSREKVYLDILTQGLLIIRSAAFQGDSEQCHIEADHLHNIPELLQHLDKEELHDFYWSITRADYIQRSKPEYSCSYQNLWEELRPALPDY